MGTRSLLLMLTALSAAACGPVPVYQAEKECLEQARLAQRPQGEVFLGVNSDGKVIAEGSVALSSDFIAGRDPSEVFKRCVYTRSGQFPTRSLSDMPQR
jgi:hypothetical protein